MKRTVALLLACFIFLSFAACSALPEEPLARAEAVLGKPVYEAAESMGFSNPASDDIALIAENGVTLCEETGTVHIRHDPAEGLVIADNPDAAVVEYVFRFDEPADGDFGFAAALYAYIEELYGAPEPPTGYASAAEADAAAIQAAADTVAVQDIWLAGENQITLSGIYYSAGNGDADKPCWMVTINVRKAR